MVQQGYAAFERGHPLPDDVRKAAWALLACRTAGLGGHIQAGPEGHSERVWYTAWCHRVCPPCAWLQVERGLDRQQARLLACDHDHVIFTMPEERSGLWLANVRSMPQLFLGSVQETRCELRGAATYLGAWPGLIAARHTWRQTLVVHPHLHGLVTGGGLPETGEWRAGRNGFLRPARVVMALFRGKLRQAIETAIHAGELPRPGGMLRWPWDNRRNTRGRRTWNVPLRERSPDGAGVLSYLARYRCGGPLGNPRWVAWAPGAVSFW